MHHFLNVSNLETTHLLHATRLTGRQTLTRRLLITISRVFHEVGNQFTFTSDCNEKVVFLITNKQTAHITGTGEGEAPYVMMSANC